MRLHRPRLRLNDRSACYHVYSRILANYPDFGVLDRHQLSLWIRKSADFCGIKLLFWWVGGREFHILLRVPRKKRISSKAVLARVAAFYGRKKAERLARGLERHGQARSQDTLDKYHRRFADLSEYQKSVKQHFSLWYADQYGKRGALWSQRFISELLQDKPARRIDVAGFLLASAERDRKPVKSQSPNAGVDDHHTLALARAGDEREQAAIAAIMGSPYSASVTELLTKAAIPYSSSARKKPDCGTFSADFIERQVSQFRYPPDFRKAHDRAWWEMFMKLEKYHSETGTTNLPWKYSADVELRKWVINQRSHKKTGRMPTVREQALEKLGFHWVRPPNPKNQYGVPIPDSDSWIRNYERLSEYYRIHGHSSPPRTYPDDRILANWVWIQRQHRRRFRLSEQQIAKLDAIHFNWNPRKLKEES